VNSVLRLARYLYAAAAVLCLPLTGQIAEPILAHSALPLSAGAGALKLDYAREQGRSGADAEVIPEVMLETGVGRGLEAILRYPLLRFKEGFELPATLGGGQLAIGARYLILGGAGQRYAVSVQAVVEAPTGDTRLVGDATQVIPALFSDWHPAREIAIHSNVLWDESFSGSRHKASFVQYDHAVVWLATAHLAPVLELAGSTNSATGRTLLAGLPEVIFRKGAHLELKAALPLGLNSQTPRFAVRFQVALFWGKRE
jgi:hypothetical protein